MKCISDADLDASFGYDPDPRSQQSFDAYQALNRRIGRGCGDRYGDQLPLYGTEQAARDMDAVRAAVGDDKLTYLGYSYGTLLGATYAQLYPQRVRALVLDGAVDPGSSWWPVRRARPGASSGRSTTSTGGARRTPAAARSPRTPGAR